MEIIYKRNLDIAQWRKYINMSDEQLCKEFEAKRIEWYPNQDNVSPDRLNIFPKEIFANTEESKLPKWTTKKEHDEQTSLKIRIKNDIGYVDVFNKDGKEYTIHVYDLDDYVGTILEAINNEY